jgi:hypothetical protein
MRNFDVASGTGNGVTAQQMMGKCFLVGGGIKRAGLLTVIHQKLLTDHEIVSHSHNKLPGNIKPISAGEIRHILTPPCPAIAARQFGQACE